MNFRTLLFVFGLWNVGDMASAGAADRIAFGVSRPPYVMQDRATGTSVELFKSVYARLERDFVPKYVSNARMEHSLSADDVDVAVEVKKTDPKIF